MNVFLSSHWSNTVFWLLLCVYEVVSIKQLLTNQKPIFCTRSSAELPLGLYCATAVVSACIVCVVSSHL